MQYGIISLFAGAHERSHFHNETPSFTIDCSTICSHEVIPEPSISDANPYVFFIDVVIFPRGQQLPHERRYIVSVSTEEELNDWITLLNTNLKVIQSPA